MYLDYMIVTCSHKGTATSVWVGWSLEPYIRNQQRTERGCGPGLEAPVTPNAVATAIIINMIVDI